MLHVNDDYIYSSDEAVTASELLDLLVPHMRSYPDYELYIKADDPKNVYLQKRNGQALTGELTKMLGILKTNVEDPFNTVPFEASYTVDIYQRNSQEGEQTNESIEKSTATKEKKISYKMTSTLSLYSFQLERDYQVTLIEGPNTLAAQQIRRILLPYLEELKRESSFEYNLSTKAGYCYFEPENKKEPRGETIKAFKRLKETYRASIDENIQLKQKHLPITRYNPNAKPLTKEMKQKRKEMHEKKEKLLQEAASEEMEKRKLIQTAKEDFEKRKLIQKQKAEEEREKMIQKQKEDLEKRKQSFQKRTMTAEEREKWIQEAASEDLEKGKLSRGSLRHEDDKEKWIQEAAAAELEKIQMRKHLNARTTHLFKAPSEASQNESIMEEEKENEGADSFNQPISKPTSSSNQKK